MELRNRRGLRWSLPESVTNQDNDKTNCSAKISHQSSPRCRHETSAQASSLLIKGTLTKIANYQLSLFYYRERRRRTRNREQVERDKADDVEDRECNRLWQRRRIAGRGGSVVFVAGISLTLAIPAKKQHKTHPIYIRGHKETLPRCRDRGVGTASHIIYGASHFSSTHCTQPGTDSRTNSSAVLSFVATKTHQAKTLCNTIKMSAENLPAKGIAGKADSTYFIAAPKIGFL
ncbi:hypothetical protein PIB30_003228 [Stylosanthes scabra]|uniref:Uncharacterized protein n=1 Tax=Stylosanthes scabra TaxID=79078 RepID=A0ABU6Q356_9FABA|nr:hypothetical protein [Stylosanthes scabra]